jgi:hypothetical protein
MRKKPPWSRREPMPWPQPWDRYDIRKNDIKKQVSAFA